MFRKVADFTQSWSSETETTLKLLRALTDASLAQRVTPEGRSLGRLAWHITASLGEMTAAAGLPTSQLVTEQSPVPAAASAITAAYETGARAVASIVPATWNDDQLDGEVPMYGEQWKRGVVLTALIAHQAHHRGQMTVLMRQAGLKVTGVYGPAREEWGAYGMTAPE